MEQVGDLLGIAAPGYHKAQVREERFDYGESLKKPTQPLTCLLKRCDE